MSQGQFWCPVSVPPRGQGTRLPVAVWAGSEDSQPQGPALGSSSPEGSCLSQEVLFPVTFRVAARSQGRMPGNRRCLGAPAVQLSGDWRAFWDMELSALMPGKQRAGHSAFDARIQYEADDELALRAHSHWTLFLFPVRLHYQSQAKPVRLLEALHFLAWNPATMFRSTG